MANHTLNPSRGNLHGSLSRSIPPVLTISPGDTVDFTTLEADWGLYGPTPPLPPAAFSWSVPFLPTRGMPCAVRSIYKAHAPK